MDEFLIHLGAFSLGIRIYFQTVTESNRILTRRRYLVLRPTGLPLGQPTNQNHSPWPDSDSDVQVAALATS